MISDLDLDPSSFIATFEQVYYGIFFSLVT